MQKHLLARYRHGSVSVVFDVVPQEVLDDTFKNKAGARRKQRIFEHHVQRCTACTFYRIHIITRKWIN